MVEIDWGGPAAWEKRDPRFTEVTTLSLARPVPVMVFEPEPTETWSDTRALWSDLRLHPNLLEAVKLIGPNGVVLRYAAIDWQYPVAPVENRASAAIVATWGAQLTNVFQLVRDVVSPARWRLLARPFAKIDLGGVARIGFAPVRDDDGPPERKLDDRSLVYIVGTLLRGLYSRSAPGLSISDVVGRCLEIKPRHRYATMRELSSALVVAGASVRPLRDDVVSAKWARVEEAFGWLALGVHREAYDCFRRVTPAWNVEDLTKARDHYVTEQLADWGERTAAALVFPNGPPPQTSFFVGTMPWASTAPTPSAPPASEPPSVAVLLARANELLASRDTAAALEHVRRAMQLEPTWGVVRVLLVRTLLAHRDYVAALSEVDAYLETTRDPAAVYLRGKVLLALGRLPEARDAFEQASKLDPSLLEAQLLRREAERTMKRLGVVVGAQQTTIEVPEALAELRDILIGGRSDEAIAALSAERYADNPEAQLVLAQHLVFAGTLDRASAIYDRLAGSTSDDACRHAALIGKAGILLEQGHAESALAIYDQMVAARSNDIDASEGRARALERLDRMHEAAAEMRRFLALATTRSDLRVRTAQLWLDRHDQAK